jgi:thiol-disulfide isomerase/thioredoxin
MRVLLMVLALAIVGAVKASEFGSLDEALKTAEKEKKNVFLYFGASWCPPCKAMKKVFSTDEVKKKLEKIPYVIVDTDENKALPKKYKVGSIPDYILLDQKGEILKRSKGAISASQFSNWLGEQ